MEKITEWCTTQTSRTLTEQLTAAKKVNNKLVYRHLKYCFSLQTGET